MGWVVRTWVGMVDLVRGWWLLGRDVRRQDGRLYGFWWGQRIDLRELMLLARDNFIGIILGDGQENFMVDIFDI